MGQYYPAFKAYDVRGVVPEELNPDLAYRVARAFADEIAPKTICIGYDIRLSGPELHDAMARGFNDAGVDVVSLGLVGTEMVYFATANYGYDGGVMITASHNPPQYNGLKMVRSESRPISGDTGLYDIERRAYEGQWQRQGHGKTTSRDVYDDFVRHLLRIVPPSQVGELNLMLDAGNGAAGVALDRLLPHLPQLHATRRHFHPDGTFPNGVPNPILEESRAGTVAAMQQGGTPAQASAPLESSMMTDVAQTSGVTPVGGGIYQPEGGGGALAGLFVPEMNPLSNIEGLKSAEQGLARPYDFGVAWDGDYDRCFFFDEMGNFIEGYYIVGLLAQSVLADGGQEGIVYDPRLTWNTEEIIARYGGRPILCKSGHAFIKEKMRAEDATYGGEMSAHHYFKAHWYCDSGMIPFLYVCKLVTQTGRSLGQLVGEMIARYPCSGEVNSKVPDVPGTLARVEAAYGSQGTVTRVDGLSVDLGAWRFNLRGSNTEPVIRLNVETRGDHALMEAKTAEVLALVRQGGGGPA